MRRMILCSLALAIVTAFVGLNTASAEDGCALIQLEAKCHDGHVTLTWNYATLPECTAEVVKIEKRCVGGYGYYTVCDFECSSPWTDDNMDPFGCLSGTYQYRLTMRCRCPNNVSDFTYETDQIFCR